MTRAIAIGDGTDAIDKETSRRKKQRMRASEGEMEGIEARCVLRFDGSYVMAWGGRLEPN